MHTASLWYSVELYIPDNLLKHGVIKLLNVITLPRKSDNLLKHGVIKLLNVITLPRKR